MSETNCMTDITPPEPGIGARVADLEQALSFRRNPIEFGVRRVEALDVFRRIGRTGQEVTRQDNKPERWEPGSFGHQIQERTQAQKGENRWDIQYLLMIPPKSG